MQGLISNVDYILSKNWQKNSNWGNLIEKIETKKAKAHQQQNILVCDDEIVNRELQQKILESLGMKVEVANSGCQAFEMITKDFERYSMVFLDQ